MIEIVRLSSAYPDVTQPVVRKLGLTICEGEFLLVCGPSGTDKSTFLSNVA